MKQFSISYVVTEPEELHYNEIVEIMYKKGWILTSIETSQDLKQITIYFWKPSDYNDDDLKKRKRSNTEPIISTNFSNKTHKTNHPN
jgi:hypothetical protein